VSDLDHAAPSVREYLGNLFLLILENGEIQTAAGAMVSCANLVFAFTMNLPAGSDERVRRSLGFGDQPSHREVGQRVIGEIKEMLSGAFLSRVGTPILFDPLTGSVLAQIAERAVESSLAAALPRLEMEPAEIIVDPAVGETVVEAMEVSIISFGVRALVERARSLSADAVLAIERRGLSVKGKRVKVLVGEAGSLTLGVE
jgi:ATP-dependent Clp protease ATP-binding subunit ClpA